MAKVQQAELSATEQTGVAVSKHKIIVSAFYEGKISIFWAKEPPQSPFY
jgi:hypothetical protein